MPTIEKITGVSTGGAYLATVTSSAADTIKITPMTAERPVLMATTAPNVQVDRGLKRLLDKAGLEPPPPGQVMTLGYLNDKLASAAMTTDERLDTKSALVRLGMVELGRRVDVFE